GNGDVAEWHYRLGKVYAQGGSRGAAGPQLAKAIEPSEAQIAQKPDRARPGWLSEAHFRYAESIEGSGRTKTIQHYRRYLELAPREDAYRPDVIRKLEGWGERLDR